MKMVYLLLLLFSGQIYAEYSLKDLEILYQNKEYEEFFTHARDIKPSERSDYWKEMVQNSASGMIEAYLKTQTYRPDYLKKIQDFLNWPVLSSDDFFKMKIFNATPSFLKLCLKEQTALSCYKDIEHIISLAQYHPDLAISVFEILKPITSTDAELALKLDFHQLVINSLKHELSEFYCQKPLIQNFILDTAYLKQLVNDDELKTFARLLHPDCLKSLEAFMVEKAKLHHDKAETAIKMTLFINPQKYSSLMVLYLLKSPEKSDWLNYSWSFLEQLKDNPAQRDELLTDLKKISPLPDGVFENTDNILNQHIVKKFAQNFPEYIDYYAHTCIQYLSGESHFPSGSPTPHCFQLKDFAKKNSILPLSTVQRIEKLQKFEK